ncbi:MAG: hypothetical protein LIO93_02995 [Bacteroidales bacterium]|nr:hypothetical protein [Bacteroidales bacterium]
MRFYFLILLVTLSGLEIYAQSTWQLRVMPQIAFGGRNTVERPNGEGTRIPLNNDFKRKSDALFSPRFELEWSYNRHHAIATVALLQDKFEGKANQDILYNNVLFNAGNNIEAVYRFNTYRLGYRYRIVENQDFNFEMGATILLRDAFISFEDEEKKTKFDNVGVAPLLSYYIEWKVLERLSLLSYGDAFAIKVGRAEDIFVGGKYRFSPLISGMLGYRLLEGGSDSDQVYTMAAFHYISLGIEVNF